MQLGKIDAAIERCDYVAKHVLPTFNTGDKIGLYTAMIAVIRVLKWHNHVDRARELYHQFIPNGTENHFAVGFLHFPMTLLLKVCEGSSLTYSITESDIELALNFEVNEFSDNIYMSDGWSANSLGAELCLHLAGRLKPGEFKRRMLVKKGIQLSSTADERLISGDDLVKHNLAYEAHLDVYKSLLRMAGIDSDTPRKSVFDVVTRPSDVNSIDNSDKGHNIINRLVFKSDTPTGSTIQSKTSSLGSAQSKVNSHEKKSKRPKQVQKLSSSISSFSSWNPAKQSSCSYSSKDEVPGSEMVSRQNSIPEE